MTATVWTVWYLAGIRFCIDSDQYWIWYLIGTYRLKLRTYQLILVRYQLIPINPCWYLLGTIWFSLELVWYLIDTKLISHQYQPLVDTCWYHTDTSSVSGWYCFLLPLTHSTLLQQRRASRWCGEVAGEDHSYGWYTYCRRLVKIRIGLLSSNCL